ncbi:hypothetical protein R3P38DRAFT_2785694 [Favolaschia claudopus]|uniref:Uncharacterized protein n=1 Tax=Favolaschia claudopus TaxID=2862362 RepID=A0AAW0AVE7_9AGAR
MNLAQMLGQFVLTTVRTIYSEWPRSQVRDTREKSRFTTCAEDGEQLRNAQRAIQTSTGCVEAMHDCAIRNHGVNVRLDVLRERIRRPNHVQEFVQRLRESRTRAAGRLFANPLRGHHHLRKEQHTDNHDFRYSAEVHLNRVAIIELANGVVTMLGPVLYVSKSNLTRTL